VNFRQQIETAWLGILWSKVLHGLIVYVATNMNLPSHIKDTTDYLKKMENLTIPENTTLITMDVQSNLS
jgi:hypothetical protein